jgi:hypothetical protein
MLGKVLIEANAELIGVRGQELRADKRKRSGIGAWIKRQQILGDGIDERELVEWYWLRGRIWRDKEIEELAAGLTDLSRGIVDAIAGGIEGPIIQRTEVAKVALALGIRRHRRPRRLALAVANPFVVAEDECAVLFNRTAKSSAELVAVQRLDAVRKETLGIHGIVAQEVPGRPVKIVGAGASDDVRGTAGAVAKFRASRMRENAKFRNRVDGRLEDETSIDPVEIVGTIDQEIVRFRPLAVHGIRLALAQGASGLRQPRGDRHDARLQHAELRKVTSIQGKIENFTIANSRAQIGCSRFNHRSIGIHFHSLRGGANGQLDREAGGLIDVQRDALLHKLAEVFGLGFQAIAADGKFHEDEIPKRIGLRRAGEVGVQLNGRDRCIANDSAARVDDFPPNARRGLLRLAPGTGAKNDQGQKKKMASMACPLRTLHNSPLGCNPLAEIGHTCTPASVNALSLGDGKLGDYPC